MICLEQIQKCYLLVKVFTDVQYTIHLDIYVLYE